MESEHPVGAAEGVLGSRCFLGSREGELGSLCPMWNSCYFEVQVSQVWLGSPHLAMFGLSSDLGALTADNGGLDKFLLFIRDKDVLLQVKRAGLGSHPFLLRLAEIGGSLPKFGHLHIRHGGAGQG